MPTYTTRTDLMHLGIVVPSGNLIELDAETAERLGDKVALAAPITPAVKTSAPPPPPTADTGEPTDTQTQSADTNAGESSTDQTDPNGSTLSSAEPKPTSKTEKTK